jgi:hypothetical protein
MKRTTRSFPACSILPSLLTRICETRQHCSMEVCPGLFHLVRLFIDRPYTSLGGVDTTSSACHVFLYNMVLRPDIQRKIQRELDESIGRGRLPTTAEAQNLSYLQAVWKESLRLDPPVPLGVPHVAAENDSWNGYFIPKGTMVNCNIG